MGGRRIRWNWARTTCWRCLRIEERTSGKLKTDDDFLLTPLDETGDGDESESGSQVIALDTEGDESATMIGAGSATAMAAMLDEDHGPARSGERIARRHGYGGRGRSPAGWWPAPRAFRPRALCRNRPTRGRHGAFGLSLFLLLFCGMIMYDLLRNMWSWDTAYSLNSSLMDTILSVFEK